MENYRLIEKLGRGTHGTAYLMRSFETAALVVCKSVIAKHSKHTRREAAILARLHHRRIVRIIDTIAHEDCAYLIMEYASGGTLEQLLQYFTRTGTRPPTGLIWSIAAQAIDALHYAHSRRVIHRDIKPSNILLNRLAARGREFVELKLCDFSLATVAAAVNDGHTVGTPFYMAPEIVAKQPYGPPVDIWALGVVLYELATLSKPFTGGSREELFHAILHAPVDTSAATPDDALNALIARCLRRADRPSARELARDCRLRLALSLVELRHRDRRIEELEAALSQQSCAEGASRATSSAPIIG